MPILKGGFMAWAAYLAAVSVGKLASGIMSAEASRPIRVLFLCTANACRSQMAEAMLHHLGGERFEAHSAGSRPAGFVHQLAIESLHALGIPILFAESKSWDRYQGERFDAVFTLCDNAAAEHCPVFAGSPLTVHWGLPDPVFHTGDDDARRAYALSVARRLQAKIEGLVALDWSADRKTIRRQLERLGEM
jgi:arsenate reductase